MAGRLRLTNGDQADRHPLQEKLENLEQKLDGPLYKALAHMHPVDLMFLVNQGNLLLRVPFCDTSCKRASQICTGHS